ncbi:MAG: cytochrome-c peroxidase, partial [Kofleriaceae bacterium]|nr:cytochrome-c peroxidase [Kofleriaceae bacterium]
MSPDWNDITMHRSSAKAPRIVTSYLGILLSLCLSMACAGESNVEGDAGPGTTNDAGTTNDGTTNDAEPGTVCGDGVVEGIEVCDDGDDNSDGWSETGHCNANCSGQAPYCGDGTNDGEESCDEGGDNSDSWSADAHCNASCSGEAPYCGDGTMDNEESCDEGGDNSDTWSAAGHCNASCNGVAPFCGDGALDSVDEMCDEGGNNSDSWSANGQCNASCSGLSPYCGDGMSDTNDGEVCDDGANNSDSWSVMAHCNSVCSGLASYCGDGNVDGGEGESCDDGSLNSNDWALNAHCNASCSDSAPYCGDDTIDTADREFCDDGAQNSDVWDPVPHCDASCSATSPLCNLTEDTSLVLPHPGVPYPAENLHSDEKAILGKVLFWEQQLSSDDTMACGTCHEASAGGSDPRQDQFLHPGPDGLAETGDDIRGSEGIARCEIVANLVVRKPDAFFGNDVQVTGRKSPSYFDAMYAPTLFWDGRADGVFLDPETGLVAIAAGGALESQSLGPLFSDVEMACENRTMTQLIDKLAGSSPLVPAQNLPPDMANAICRYPTYSQLFEQAFGDDAITGTRIAFAIATYERSLVSDQTPYDLFVDPMYPQDEIMVGYKGV